MLILSTPRLHEFENERNLKGVDLTYRTGCIGDLQLGECTVRGAHDGGGRRWWMLWAWVRRNDTGEPFYVAVPVNPSGPDEEVGRSGRRTWSLARVDATTWRVSPSVDVVGNLRPDGTREPSLWHQTPRVVGVPETEPWTAGPT